MSCHSTSGGIVSTSLARAISGLSEQEIQRTFHALKREAHGLPAPSELDVAEWRSRQYDLLQRMRSMKPNRKDSLRDRLFRSRSESVPDGSTFYAWSRLEARARQEATLNALDSAVIDLEPPGSQADQYDLGEDGRPKRVWYASYGSNLHRDRFMNYIEGGSPEGSSRIYDGCEDPTPPTDDIPIRFSGSRPHFALTSRVWRGGIAFIDQQPKDATAQGLGRAYNVSIDQFDGVVAQENGGSSKEARPVPLDEALTEGRSVTGTGSYETIMHIGDYQGAPVLTFTAPFTTQEAVTKTGYIERVAPGGKTPVRMPVMTNKPSAAYLRMIGGGLNETFGMDETQQADYLRGCPGGERWTRQQMVRILRGQDPEPPRATAPEDAKKTSKTTTSKTTTGKTTDKPAQKGTKTNDTADETDANTTKGDNNRSGSAGRAGRSGSAAQAPLFSHGPDGSNTSQTTRTSLAPGRPRGARTNQNTTSRSERINGGPSTTSGSTQDNGNGAVRPVPLRLKNDGTFTLPGLKTYTSTEEQKIGIKRWQHTVGHLQQIERTQDREVTRLEALAAEQAKRPTAPPVLKHTRSMLETTIKKRENSRTLLTEANRNVERAQAQTPTHYYSRTITRTVSGWRDEDARVLATSQTLETQLDAQRQELLRAQRTPGPAGEARSEKVQAQIDRTRTMLDECHTRLQETHEILARLTSSDRK